MDSVTRELQKVAPSAIIELYRLTLATALHGSSTVYRFHAGVNGKNDGGDIIWDGQSYQAYPVEAEGFAYNGEGQLPRPKLRISNQLGLVTTILLTVNQTTPGNDLLGAKVERIRVLAKHIDANNFPGNTNPYGTPDPTAELPREVYYIARKAAENRDAVEFELASVFDLANIRAPRRLCVANLCNWVYRSAECGYTGDAYFDEDDQPVQLLADDACSKRLSGCEKRFAPVSITATTTAGSNTLTNVSSAELASIQTGDPINGHGIPQGTTVTSKTSNTLVLSQAATSSSVYTMSGTLQLDGTAIDVANATYLPPGMTVTGPNVPDGTRIASISGNRLTFNIAFNPYILGTLLTRIITVSKEPFDTAEYWLMDNTSGISVGDFVGNNEDLSANHPQGEKIYYGTKVTEVLTDRIKISNVTTTLNGISFVAAFWKPATFSSATYTFTGSPKYAIGATRCLPFGSFPGVGGYVA